jgi:prefoldin subunit 5
MSYTVESLDFDEYFGNHRIKNFVRGKMIRVSDYMHDLIDSFVARYFSEVSVKNAINEMKEKIDEYESDIADFDKIINDASKSDTEKEEILEKKEIWAMTGINIKMKDWNQKKGLIL